MTIERRDDVPDATAASSCPYCGEAVELLLDPGGAATQRYVEDCPVCCRPWSVRVSWDGEGRAEVELEPENL